MEYLSYTSLDDILFSDSQELGQALIDAGIRSSFMGIDNAADAVANTVDLSRRALRLDVFGVALGAAVLTLSALVLAAVYCDRRRRPVFVELIHGYGFARRHRWFLPAVLALPLAAVGSMCLIGHLTQPRDLAAAAALVALQAGATGGAVKVYEARFGADFIKRD
jgi:hypothetical protein